MPYIGIDEFNNVLAHYGVKGQKHGVRRWTNPDGTLTPEGYRHYGINPREYSKLDTKDEIKSQIKQDKQLTKYENQKRKEQAKLELSIKKANQKATRKNIKKYVVGGLVATGFAALGYSYIKNKNLKRETASKLAILRQEGENAEALKKYDLKIKRTDVSSARIEARAKQAAAEQESLAKRAESNKEINRLKEEERIRQIKRKEANAEKKQQVKEAEAEKKKLEREANAEQKKLEREANAERKKFEREAKAERKRLEREAEAERKRLEIENAKKVYYPPQINIKNKKTGENWFSQYKKKHTSRFQQYQKAQEKKQRIQAKVQEKTQRKQDKYYRNVSSILNKRRTGERWYTNLFSGFNTYISQSDEDGISFYDIGNEYLAHYGVKGQSWGVRRYQNEDGTLTEEGRRHYGLKYDLDDKTLRDAINYERTKKAYEDLITSSSSKSKASISGTIKTATDTLKKANNITGDLIGLSTDRLISNLEAQKKAIVIPKNATDAEKKALNTKKDQIQADIDADRKAKKVLDSTKNAANTLNEFAGNDKVTNKIADLITSESRQEEKALAKDAVNSLSEQELNNLVNRLRLEQEYEQIVNPPKKSKNDIAREWLQTAGTILTLAGLGVKLYKNVKGIKVDDGNN